MEIFSALRRFCRGANMLRLANEIISRYHQVLLLWQVESERVLNYWRLWYQRKSSGNTIQAASRLAQV